MSVISTYYNRPLGIYKMSSARKQHVLSLCKDARASRVLDIGCGIGDFGSLLKKEGIYVAGADVSSIAIQEAAKVLDEAVVLDLEEDVWSWPEQSFDTVVMSEVIEHLFEPALMVRKIFKVLKPGGSLIVTTPNFLMFSNRIRMLFGAFQYTESGFMDHGHIHFFTRPTLNSLLCSEGFDIAQEKNIFHPKIPKWIASIFPNLFTYQMVVRATKKDDIPDAGAVTCNVCGSGVDPFLSKDGYKFLKCRVCGLVFVHPRPKKEFLANELYSATSGYQGNKKKSLQGVKPTDKEKIVLSWLSKMKKGKLLDIGCSNGEFMWLAKEAGFDVVGVELNERTATIARDNGLKVVSSFIEDAGFEPRIFDYVYMGDLIEHVSNPAELIRKACELLNENGKIIIITPNLDCFWSRSTFSLYKLFGIPWSSLTPPYHLYQFSIGNLDLLLEKHSFSKMKEAFVSPPPLRYELGSLHLYRMYKKRKNITNLFRMVFSYCLYTIAYSVTILSTPLLRKNFQMVALYKNDR